MMRYFNKVYNSLNRPVTVIDFGAGSGFFALELLEKYPDKIEEVLLIDINYNADELNDTSNKRVRKLHKIPSGIDYCIVLMMDVLEHIEDDAGILSEIVDSVGPNSHYFITVPAFMSLWSGHDVYLGHFRRYTRKMLNELLDSSSCKVEASYYIYGMLFPLVWMVRKIKSSGNEEKEPDSDMGNVPFVINEALRLGNTFEMNFRKLNKFRGVTCVAEGKLK